MTTGLKRRLAALEAHTSLKRPVSEMSDAELLKVIGLGDNPSDEQLLEVIECADAATPEGAPVSAAEDSERNRTNT